LFENSWVRSDVCPEDAAPDAAPLLAAPELLYDAMAPAVLDVDGSSTEVDAEVVLCFDQRLLLVLGVPEVDALLEASTGTASLEGTDWPSVMRLLTRYLVSPESRVFAAAE